jgi:hypothetical protein
MAASELEAVTAADAWSPDDPTVYDPDDMFGVRRALGAVTPAARDRFFDRWVELTEACDLDLRRIHAAVRRERGDASLDDELGAAWRMVDEAMAAYLGWRAVR